MATWRQIPWHMLLLAMTVLARGEATDDDGSELLDILETSYSPSRDMQKGCECVPYYLCENNTIVCDGSNIIDIRIKDAACTGFLEVCCREPLDEPIAIPITLPEGCGLRNTEGVGFRISGGYDGEAQFAEFPWMIAVLKVEEVESPSGPFSHYVYQCGGSLIHPSVVLTAAHCVSKKKPETLLVRAGEWDTQTTNELYNHEDRTVEDIVIHKQYYAGGLFYDVALLFLTEPFEQKENICFACLPNQGELPEPGTHCFASGWGKDVYGKEGEYQVILKKVELPIVERNKCQEALRTTRLGSHFKLHPSFICAGGEPGKDTCKGDGGSPLVCPIPGHPGRYYQSGIVAWGIGCGETGLPGVYANVAIFRNWIDEHLALKHLDHTHYIN